MSSPNYIVGRAKRPEEVAADQAFLAEKRKLSPLFPDVATALERRRDQREKFAARIMLALTAGFGIAAPFSITPALMLLTAGACLVGFMVVCFVAGNRKYVNSGASNGQRPF